MKNYVVSMEFRVSDCGLASSDGTVLEIVHPAEDYVALYDSRDITEEEVHKMLDDLDLDNIEFYPNLVIMQKSTFETVFRSMRTF